MLKEATSALLAALQTRVALLGNEIQVEKHRALRQFVWVLSFVFALGFVALMLVGLALTLWWDSRVLVLGGCAVLFALLAAYVYARLRTPMEPIFAASLAELQEDLRQLRAATAHEEKPS